MRIIRTTKQPVPASSPFASHVGIKLNELRQQHQKTMRDVATGVGMSVAFICQIENGQSVPSILTACKLAKFFSVDVGFFVEGFEGEL